PGRRERAPDHRTATFVVYRVRSAGHEGRSPSGGGTPLPGATSPAETGEIRARGEARRSEVDQSILQRLVRFGDVNVADKGCTTSRCSKAIIPEVDVLRSPIANTQRDEAMSRLIASFLVGLLLFGANAAHAQIRVTRVIDGDTYELSTGERVRLIGIDTPEKHVSTKLDRDAERTGRDRAAIRALGELAS